MTRAIIETKRLRLSQLTRHNDRFILKLLNEPSFIQYIGDKNVRSLNDAREYIKNGPQASYKQHGFGLYLITLKSDVRPIGICGFIKRDDLEFVDLDYAFLPEDTGSGYALEASTALFNMVLTSWRWTRLLLSPPWII